MKVLKIAAIVVGVVALAATGIGLAAGASVAGAFGAATAGIAGTLGISTGIASAIVVGALAVDAMMLTSALTPKPKATEGSGGATDKWKADPRAGIPYSMGRSYTGGNIIFKRGHGQNNVWLTTVTALSLGTIASIEGSYADFNALSFNGTAATGSYNGHLYESRQLGHLPETSALTPPADTPTGWDATCKLSGLAATMNSFKYDTSSSNSFTAIPQMGWIVRGVLVYDPRQDSTYPGGSGSCRAGDESTYIYSDNPGLHALTWAIGRFQNGTRVAGIGALIDTLDIASFVECANLCDARGWVVGGQVYTRPDTLWNSLQAILQAGGAAPVFYAGKISVINRAPKVSLATITRDDIVGDVSFAATTARRDRINTVIPSYRSEDHQWQVVSAAAVSVESYADLDGDERTKEINYPLVQAVNQVAELALYDICDSREAGPGTIPTKPWTLNYRPGDCVTFQPEDGAAIKVQITGRTLDADTGAVTLDVRGETDAKHAFALGETGTPPPINSLHYDNAVAPPNASDWTVTGTTVTANGTTVPAIDLEGACSNASADAIITEYRESNLGDNAGWTATGIDAPTTKSKIISGVKSATRYDVSVRYRVRGILGDRHIYGPVTTGFGAADWAVIGGTGRPQDNATVGATTGINLIDNTSGATLTTNDIKTSIGTSADTSKVAGVPASTITANLSTSFAAVTDTTPPDVPTNLALTSTVAADSLGNQIVTLTVTWRASTASDTAGYVLSVSTNNGGYIDNDVGNVTTWTATLPANTSVSAKVAAYDRNTNKSAYSSVVSTTTTKDTVAPAVATNLSATTLGLSGITVSWTNPADSDLSKALVYESSTNNNASATLVSTVNASAGGTSSTTLTRTTGSTFYYWVKTQDTSGNLSGFSAGVSGTVASVSNANLTPGLSAIQTVSALPAASGYTGPSTVLLSTDGKLYRYVSGAWTAAVGGTDIVASTIPNSAFASSNLSSLSSTETIKNTLVTIDANGAVQGIGSGAGTVLSNAQIALINGAITGIGTGSGTVVDNTKISVSNGAISGIGTGTGTVVDNTKLTMTANGALIGGGGGAVTITGLGYTGALNATVGDNLLTNPSLANGATGWNQNSSVVVTAGTTGDPVSRYFAVSAANQSVGAPYAQIPAGSRRLYVTYWLYRSDNQQITNDMTFLDANNNYLGFLRINDFGNTAVGSWAQVRYTFDGLPDRAAQFAFGNVLTAAGPTKLGGYHVGLSQMGSDITALDPKVGSLDYGAAKGDNLIINADLRDNLNNWYISGTPPVRTAGGNGDPVYFWRATNANSAVFANNSNNPANFPLEASKRYYVSGKYRCSATSLGMQPTFYAYNVSIGYLGGSAPVFYPTVANTWTDFAFYYDVPAGAAFGYLSFSMYASAGGTVDVANCRCAVTQYGATLGAPSGTMVGSTLAQTVEARANDPASQVNVQTTTINGGKITTGTITAGQIAANTIVANNIASSAITADKLIVQSGGSALNADPYFQDSTAWVNTGLTFTSITDGVSGTSVITSPGGNGNPNISAKALIPVDPNKTYRFQVWTRGNGSLYAGIGLFDSAGNTINGDGTYWYYVAAYATPGSSWTRYTATFGFGTSRPFPANAKTMFPVLYLSYNQTPSNQAQDIRIEEVLPGTLIQDGAITTNKVAANAITAGQIAANSITADRLTIGAIKTNMVYNGNAETGTAAGWAFAEGVTTSITASNALANTGNYSLKIANPGAGTYAAYGCRAMPVTPGKTYAWKYSVRDGSGSGGNYFLFRIEYYTAQPTSGYVSSAQGNRTNLTDIGGYVAQPSFQTYQNTWTCPAGVAYASLVAYNFPPGVSSTYAGSDLYFDDIEFYEQVGATIIQDGAIVTAKIAAGAVTANSIAANTIVASNIAAGTITGNLIAGNTIVANNLAAGAISADKLSVSVGGSNLLKNSGFESGLVYSLNGGTMPAGYYLYDNGGDGVSVPSLVAGRRGGLAYQISFSGNHSTKGIYLENIGGINNQATWKTGQTYVWSFYAKATGGAVGLPMGLNWNYGPTQTSVAISNPPLTTDWQRYAFRIAWTPGTSVDNNGFISLQGGFTTGGTLVLDDLQIEEGDYPTAYAAGMLAGEITGTLIQEGAITTNKIAANTITGNNIAGATITGNNMVARTLTAGAIVAGTLTSNEIAANTITANNIAAGTITAAQIAAATITGNQIAANSITAGALAAGTITADKIAGGTITGDKFNTGTSLPGTITVGSTGVSIGTVQSQTADGLGYVDTRNDNQPPSYYYAKYAAGSRTVTEFKTASAIGVNIGGYGQLLTTIQWQDASGGPVQQEFRDSNGHYWNRTGTGSSWSTWIDTGGQINSGYTQISPGMINIAGSTTLANWRNGGDNTKIEGGSIATNTIAANKLTVGNRNVQLLGITFANDLGNVISWTAGYVDWYDENYNRQVTLIRAGSCSRTSQGGNVSGVAYVWFDRVSSSQNNVFYGGEIDPGTVMSNPNNVIVASYFGANNMNSNFGQTIIDGSGIRTNSITATQIAANSITADKLQIGSSSGARTAISNNLIQVFDSNNTLRVRLGVF